MTDYKEKRLQELLSIGITTKGRLTELRKTLEILEKSELRNCQIILIDDGGGAEFITEQEYSLNLTIKRYDKSSGLIARRNELAQHCDSKYLMSLDDDSAPEEGSINEVIDLLEKDATVAAVAFNLYNKDKALTGVDKDDYVSRYYVGCGHVVDVSIFRALGGYTSALFYGHEEIELSLKIVRAGYKIIHKNNYVVLHRKSNINRVVGYNRQMVYNAGWVRGTYLGFAANLIEIFSVTKGMQLGQRIVTMKDHYNGVLERAETEKLTFRQYWRWKRSKTPSVA